MPVPAPVTTATLRVACVITSSSFGVASRELIGCRAASASRSGDWPYARRAWTQPCSPRWPAGPRCRSVYGVAAADRASASGTCAASRSATAPIREFIGRNYAADANGRWFFQNGPQRVYVSLELAPWVYPCRARRQSCAPTPAIAPHARCWATAAAVDGDVTSCCRRPELRRRATSTIAMPRTPAVERWIDDQRRGLGEAGAAEQALARRRRAAGLRAAARPLRAAPAASVPTLQRHRRRLDSAGSLSAFVREPAAAR
ncbi:MAG: DUF2946 family protein [Comamonadaceae bacterium]|nr:DUF2946 family protein [Comamonadaceae bacterium]